MYISTHETILLVNIMDIAITPPQEATDLLSVTADYLAFSKCILFFPGFSHTPTYGALSVHNASGTHPSMPNGPLCGHSTQCMPSLPAMGIWGLTNKAVTDIHGRTFVWTHTFISFGYWPRSGADESYFRSMFNFFKKLPNSLPK